MRERNNTENIEIREVSEGCRGLQLDVCGDVDKCRRRMREMARET